MVNAALDGEVLAVGGRHDAVVRSRTRNCCRRRARALCSCGRGGGITRRSRCRRASIPSRILIDSEAIASSAELSSIVGTNVAALAIISPQRTGAEGVATVALRSVLSSEILVRAAEVRAVFESHEVAGGRYAAQSSTAGGFGVAREVVEWSVAHSLWCAWLRLHLRPSVREDGKAIATAANLAGVSGAGH